MQYLGPDLLEHPALVLRLLAPDSARLRAPHALRASCAAGEPKTNRSIQRLICEWNGSNPAPSVAEILGSSRFIVECEVSKKVGHELNPFR